MIKYFSLPALALAGVYMVYTNDYQAHEAINTVVLYAGYVAALALVLGAAYLILKYVVPLVDDHQDRQRNRQFIQANEQGLYPLPIAAFRDERTLPALLVAMVERQREEPRTLVNAPAAAAPAMLVEETHAALPDVVRLSDYRSQIKEGYFALGILPDNSLLQVQLKDVWHLLNNAQSGSGKTNNLDSFVCQIHRLPHSEMHLYLTDYKGELRAVWGRSPLVQAIGSGANVGDIQDILMHLAAEIHRRNHLFEQAQERYPDRIIRGYASYRLTTRQSLPMIYLICDELNALMSATKGNETLRGALGAVLQMGRSAGINLLSGAQHLTAETLPKEYFTNFATRVSMGMYDAANTVRLLGAKPSSDYLHLITGQPGRALVKVNGQQQPLPVQMFLVEDRDILDAIAYSSDKYGVEPVEPTFSAYEPREPGCAEPPEKAINDDGQNYGSLGSERVRDSSSGSDLSHDAKVWAVKYLRRLGKGKSTIIEEVWNVKKGGSERYRQASTEYDDIITSEGL